MGQKRVVIVPRIASDVQFDRFHADATDKPLYTIVVWSCQDREDQQVAINASGKLMEIQQMGAAKSRSWFINNQVQQDGTFLVMTPLDPLFLLLQTCWSKRQRFQSLYELLSTEKQLWWLRLSACNVETISKICDIQSGTEQEEMDNVYIRANDAKIEAWLSTKIDQMTTVLAKQARESKGNGAGFDQKFMLPGQTAPSNATEITESVDNPKQFVGLAIEILGEYLANEWIQRLQSTYASDLQHQKQPVDNEANPCDDHMDAIRRFDVRNQPLQEVNSNKRNAAIAAANSSVKKKSKLVNVDTSGMKSIMSFFGKKP